MNKLNRIFSIVLTAAIAMSLLVVSGFVPASAASNAWSEFKVPSATNVGMPNNITSSGLLTTAINGDLFAYVNNGTSMLARSINGGRAWTTVNAPVNAPITAIATSPSEANVLYIAVASTIYKSIDSGATFTTRGTVLGTVTAIGAALAGGSYKLIVGTSTGTGGGNTYFQDEGQFFLSFSTFGTFPAGLDVIDLKLSPTFATDQGIAVLATQYVLGVATNTNVLFSTNGGVFGASIKTATFANTGTMGEISLPSDFVVSAPALFIGVTGTAGGLYRIVGAPASSVSLSSATSLLSAQVVTMDNKGPFATAVLMAGMANGTVQTSINSGLTFTVAKKLVGTGAAFVALKSDFATSLTSYVLQAGAGPNDENGFAISVDSGANFNYVSFLNSNNVVINNVAVASNGDVFMITTNGNGSADSFTLTATAIGAATVTQGSGTVTVTMSGTGTAVLAGGVWTITFAAVGEVATVTATTAGTETWTTGVAAPTAAKKADANGSMTVGATGVAFAMDMNAATGNSLWRSNANGWERVATGAVGAITNVQVSPNYATDKGVFYVATVAVGTVAANTIWASANNGQTFSAQPSSNGAAIVDYKVIDAQTFVDATTAGIVRTANNGFIWNTVSSTVIPTMMVRSSDGTTLAAVNAAGAISKSTDLGVTWSTPTTVLLAGANKITFQNGSNNVIWATTTAGGVYSIDLSAATVAWSARMDVGAGVTAMFDSPALANTLTVAGIGIVSGSAITSGSAIYAMGNSGSITRVLSGASMAGVVNQPTTSLFSTATQMFIQPAAGANIIWVNTGAKLFNYTDTMAVAVPTTAVASFTTATANVTFAAVTGATAYTAVVKVGSVGAKDVYTAANPAGVTVTVDSTALTANFAGLTSNTTYTVSVWAVAPVTSFAGTVAFSTKPATVITPVNLAPADGATGIAITPGFGWGAVAGATSYTVEVSTVPTFATLVGTKQTTTIPAFAWTTPALANNTTYYWRVIAITTTGSSDPVIGVFTTVAAPVTTTAGPTTSPITITNTSVVVTSASTETPGYIWAIIGIGALLVIVVIVLIVRTRRVA